MSSALKEKKLRKWQNMLSLMTIMMSAISIYWDRGLKQPWWIISTFNRMCHHVFQPTSIMMITWPPIRCHTSTSSGHQALPRTPPRIWISRTYTKDPRSGRTNKTWTLWLCPRSLLWTHEIKISLFPPLQCRMNSKQPSRSKRIQIILQGLNQTITILI